MQSDLPKFLIVFWLLCSSALAGDKIVLHLDISDRQRAWVVFPDVFPFDRSGLDFYIDGAFENSFPWNDLINFYYGYPDYMPFISAIDFDSNGIPDINTILTNDGNPWYEWAEELEIQAGNGGGVDLDPVSFENPYLTNILLSLLLGVNLFHVAIRKSYL